MGDDDPFDVWEDPEVQGFLERAEREMAPKMRNSSLSLSIVPDNQGDAKFWVELGASIMFEKPIILLIVEGRTSLPQKLQMVADAVIVIPEGGPDEKTAQEIEETIKRVLGD